MADEEKKFVSRGGLKLEEALKHFKIDLGNKTTVDLGSNVGGFVDCQLKAGCQKIYSVDTSYGTLAWELRQNSKVEVVERANALHWQPEEKVDFISIDVGWTPQKKILPVALKYLKEGGEIVSLLKPQYESNDDERNKGLVKADCLDAVVARCLESIKALDLGNFDLIESPIQGNKGNREFLLYQKK
jgi:23S rRNA (cytidine1920-2'-O)/16S rRNA (cytidine1409-2'-O)-methyltransferase